MAAYRVLARLMLYGAFATFAISFFLVAMSGTTTSRATGSSHAAPGSTATSIAAPRSGSNLTPSAGPPYPDAVTGQRVYDYAGIFSQSARSSAEATIRTIEDRTGAQIAIYTQVKPESNDLQAANADARALMDQWGVGRKGFDDGLVILFDMENNKRHGEASLYAGSGFRAAYLTDAERQAIFDSDMKPLLLDGDFDGALAAGLRKIDAAATPQHSADLERARQINAVVGIFVLGIAIWLMAFVLIRWYTDGRDPIYIDDNSVLMAAPPEGLTPAMATLLMTDKTSSRTVSAGLVDLAAHGLLEFRDESSLLRHRAGIAITGDKVSLPQPESLLFRSIEGQASANAGYIKPGDMSRLADAVKEFGSNLEDAAARERWLTDAPSKVIFKWCILAFLEVFVSVGLILWTLHDDASGGLLGGGGLAVAALFTFLMARLMPCRTRVGSMLRAMLAAYRRTLQATMRQAQSMDEVVESKALPWARTPDAVMAWGVAFGLEHEVEAILRRTVDASKESGNLTGWYPGWWVSSPGQGLSFAGTGGGGGGGMFSASAIPDVGSMMSALGSIGSSAGHSGGGGFGGGGGGGGGGAGGGF
jgi:uncharacterized membrane protein YgcG